MDFQIPADGNVGGREVMCDGEEGGGAPPACNNEPVDGRNNEPGDGQCEHGEQKIFHFLLFHVVTMLTLPFSSPLQLLWVLLVQL